MNCYTCERIVGLNNENQWIPYQRTRNIRKEYEYICSDCYFEIYKRDFDNWVCYGCNDMQYYTTEFCYYYCGYYNATKQYCISCLQQTRETSNKDLCCDCNICKKINNCIISFK